MIPGIIASGLIYNRLKIQRIPFPGFEEASGLFVSVHDSSILVGQYLENPPRVDFLQNTNGSWDTSYSIYSPVQTLYFGIEAYASGDSLLVQSFSETFNKVIHLFSHISGVWVHQSSIAAAPNLVASVFTQEGHLALFYTSADIVTYVKTDSSWSTTGEVQNIGMPLAPWRIKHLSLDSFILTTQSSDTSTGVGLTFYKNVVLTLVAGVWTISPILETTSGYETLYPVAAKNDRILFYHSNYGVLPTPEFLEYRFTDGQLLYSNSVPLPPQTSGNPFDPDQWGLGQATYLGNKLLISALGPSGLIWCYNLNPDSVSYDYTLQAFSPLYSLENSGVSVFESTENFSVIKYTEGQYIDDGFGGTYLEPSNVVGLYIIS